MRSTAWTRTLSRNWLQVGKYMAIALGGIIAIRKTYQFGKNHTRHHESQREKAKGYPVALQMFSAPV